MDKQKTTKQISNSKSSTHFTTDLFKDKQNIPTFITSHPVFKKPHQVSKIFPSIGLKNFKEPCELIKPLVDLKKENFITALLTTMYNGLSSAREAVMQYADRAQFLFPDGDEKNTQLAKIDDAYNLLRLLKSLITQIDIYNEPVYQRVICNSQGKIALRLSEKITDGNGKTVFGKEESLFKVFTKLKEQFAALNLNFIDLEQTNEFKTFCVENIPNKEYKVVFSSEGAEGAWDILTMSMRGIKSCQRWDGDYPRCLIGSVLSKFVGIIYITSGADFGGFGAKMMRRSIVRYAIDADENTPCLLIDKIYPALGGQDDEDILRVFKKALESKTSLPVYFAPSLGAKVKHFYIPFEKIREEVSERDWTYQDTPLKTNIDFKLHVLASASNEDALRYVNCFKAKLIAQLGEQYRKVISNNIKVEPEIAKTLSNIRLNASFDRFNEQIVKLVFDRFTTLMPKNQHHLTDPKEYYRKYLVQLAIQLKNIKSYVHTNISILIDQSTSREIKKDMFCDFLFNKLIKEIIMQEIKISSSN